MSILNIALLASLTLSVQSGDIVRTSSVRDSAGTEVGVADTWPRRSADSTRVITPGIDSSHALTIFSVELLQDTIPRRRSAVAYSDAYGTRAKIHRRLSYAMLPLFATSYFTGDRLFKDGPEAASWVKNTHRAAATGSAVLFGANAVTGVWNLWEARHDTNDRKRRILHSALFMAATAGFTYSGAVLAEQAEKSADKRRQHRTVNLVSMGLSTGSVLVMLVGRD